MAEKSRSARHQRIMDLLDNALETPTDTHIGLTSVGRAGSCIRCSRPLNDPDASWCEMCHPAHETPTERKTGSKAHDVFLSSGLTRMEYLGGETRTQFPPNLTQTGRYEGTVLEPNRYFIDTDRWHFAQLDGDELARRWVRELSTVTRIDLRRYNTNWTQAITGPGHSITEWGWAVSEARLLTDWAWAGLTLHLLPLGPAWGLYYPGMPGCREQGLEMAFVRRYWEGAIPVAVLRAFFDDPEELGLLP